MWSGHPMTPMPEKKPVGWECIHCLHWEPKEQEVMCWECGIGEMVWQSENQAHNNCHDAFTAYLDEVLDVDSLEPILSDEFTIRDGMWQDLAHAIRQHVLRKGEG